jgi:hypothetical protein
MVSGEFETVRDAALAERNRDNYIRWADAYARGDCPRDRRNWQEQDRAADLHARAHYLRKYARRLHAARYNPPKVVNIKAFRSEQR